MKKISKEQVKDWVKKHKSALILGVMGIVAAGTTVAIVNHDGKKIEEANAIRDIDAELENAELWTAKFYDGEGELKGEVPVYDTFAKDFMEINEEQ